MKFAAAASALMLVSACSASATQNWSCSTARVPNISLLFGMGSEGHVFSMKFYIGAVRTPVAVAQSWFDEDEFRLKIVAENGERRLAVLKTRYSEQSGSYDGDLTYQGKSYWVRCSSD